MMMRMKDREGNYDLRIVDKMVKHFLYSHQNVSKLEMSYPRPMPHDLAHAMTNMLIEIHGMDIVIADQEPWAVSLVGVKAL